eukprot:2889794-Pyramimonas_sp.AAC.1
MAQVVVRTARQSPKPCPAPPKASAKQRPPASVSQVSRQRSLRQPCYKFVGLFGRVNRMC